MPNNSSTSAPQGCFRFGNFLLWFVLSLVVAGMAALVSWHIQRQGFAPVGLNSILLGGVLGATFVGLLRLTGQGHRWSAIISTLVLASVVSIGQHFAAYHDYRQTILQKIESDPQAAFFRAALPEMGPASFTHFLQSRARAGMLAYWVMDAALILSAATIAVYLATRQAFCNTCHSWFRTIRSGPVSPKTVEKLSLVCKVQVLPDDHQFSIRLASCLGRCGPCRIDLSWKLERQTENVTRWLSKQEYSSIATILLSKQ